MKRVITMLLMFVLTVGINSAFATTTESGGLKNEVAINDGTKVELLSTVEVADDPAFQIASIKKYAVVELEFNLSVGLVTVVQTPWGGQEGGVGWHSTIPLSQQQPLHQPEFDNVIQIVAYSPPVLTEESRTVTVPRPLD